MPSLFKDSRSPYWIGCYTAANGQRLKKSTKETNKAKARQIVHLWQSLEVRTPKRGATAYEQARRVALEALGRLFDCKPDDPTIREYYERWLVSKRGTVGEGTLACYTSWIHAFLAFFASQADLRLEILTTQHFLAYRNYLLTQGVSPRTINGIFSSTLKPALKLALAQGLLTLDPLADPVFPSLRQIITSKGTFTDRQIVSLLDYVDRNENPEWHGLILIAVYTGGRLSDLLNLRWQDIDLAERSVAFVQRKTGTKVSSWLHPELHDYLMGLSSPDDGNALLFPTLHQLIVKGSSSTVSKRFGNILKGAGIQSPVKRSADGPRGRTVSALTFHSFRHSFVSRLVAAGVPPELRKKLSGHLSDSSHSIYSHHEAETLRSAVESLPRLARK